MKDIKFRGRCYNLSSAFTLAEVLITLGIIGVVAAITLPTLIANYKEKVIINQAKKELSTIINALSATRARHEFENNGEIFNSANESDTTANLIFANMNVAKRCKKGNSNCLKNYKIKEEKPINDGYGNYRLPSQPPEFSNGVLSNGTIVGVHQTKYPQGSCTNYYTIYDKDANGNYILDSDGNKMNPLQIKETDCGHIFFDVNGLKGPNQYGIDIYLIYVTPYGYIQSSGLVDDVIRTGKITAENYDINGKFE